MSFKNIPTKMQLILQNTNFVEGEILVIFFFQSLSLVKKQDKFL
jgi:hypothetical protein